MAYWTAARTRQHQESRAACHVENQGFSYYLPRMVEGRRTVFMFPTWIFIRIDGGWRCLLGTRGISQVLLWREVPARIPDREIEAIRSLEDADGRVLLPANRFSPGERVLVRGGALVNMIGTVETTARDRCRVLFEMMGRLVRVPVDPSLLEAA